MSTWMWIAIGGGAAIAAGAAWLFWPVNSARDRELADPSTRFHWVVITSYRGLANPTMLSPSQARDILQGGWSCDDRAALVAKIDAYRGGGEINPAFDVARILWLSELARSAQWLDQGAVRAYSQEGVARLRASYRDWASFADALVEGRQRWYLEIAGQPSMPADQHADAAASRQAAQPLWASTPW